jgi:hypothetical protein
MTRYKVEGYVEYDDDNELVEHLGELIEDLQYEEDGEA